MDFNATIDLIIRELLETHEILDDLEKSPGALVLEIEIAKSKIRNAADVIKLLKEKNYPAEPKIEPQGDTPAKEKEPERKVKEAESKHLMTKTDDPGKKHEPTPKEAEKTVDPGKPEIDSSEKKPFVAPIIADSFSHLANRFNEQIGQNQEDDFSYTHGKSYSNLSDAIGVNDRFYYIRELFDGNRDIYNETIGKLEFAKDVNEAKEILSGSIMGKHDLKAEKQLLDLVRKKFSSHE